MENATKALLIAGGVLLAIIIISLFVSMYKSISGLEKAQDEKIEMQQISAFNAEYEAFDKKIMYGTDVITVMKKAINHNKQEHASSGASNCINIIVKPSTTFQSSIEIYEEDKEPVIKEGLDAKPTADLLGISLSCVPLEGNKEYSLGDWTDGKQNLEMNKDMIAWFTSFAEDTVEKRTIKNVNYIYHIISGVHEFKTHIFKCTNVSYDKYGRINEMTFEEK